LGVNPRTHVRLLLCRGRESGTETGAVDIVLSGNRDVSFGPISV
jgi:hypothetical protein